MAVLKTASGKAALLAMATLAWLAARPASAEDFGSETMPACGAYDQMRELLAQQYGERPTASGLADDGTVMQVFASARATTWTVVSIDTSGMACVVAAGRGWQHEAAAKLGDPA